MWTSLRSLHRFVIHGVEDGIGHAGGVGFRDDPHRVHLADLGLRPTERFVDDDGVTAGWRLDLRLEAILAAEAGRVYPRCTGGRRSGPPEGCGGPRAFTEYTQPRARSTGAGRVVSPNLVPLSVSGGAAGPGGRGGAGGPGATPRAGRRRRGGRPAGRHQCPHRRRGGPRRRRHGAVPSGP